MLIYRFSLTSAIFVLASHRLIAFVINIVDVDSAIARQAYSLLHQYCMMRYIMSSSNQGEKLISCWSPRCDSHTHRLAWSVFTIVCLLCFPSSEERPRRSLIPNRHCGSDTIFLSPSGTIIFFSFIVPSVSITQIVTTLYTFLSLIHPTFLDPFFCRFVRGTHSLL